MPYKSQLNVRVYYQDTDAYGIVYHANYLKFAERGRYEYFHGKNPDYFKRLQSMELMMVARHIEIDYFAPARIEDLLLLESWIVEIKNSSMAMQTDIYLEDKLINTVKCVFAVINGRGAPVRIPDEIRSILS